MRLAKMTMERIDKVLARQMNISRNDARLLIRKRKVTINGNVVKSYDEKCIRPDVITVNGEIVNNMRFSYIMLNKPKGVISASSDGHGEQTVIDLIPEHMQRKKLFPVGRLDKNTTGFILITDDGDFGHVIITPKKHINKTYVANLDKPFTQEVKEDFESGMMLTGRKLLRAEIEPVDGDYTVARVVLKQGLYHQIKRMFKKHGIEVVELKRTAMGKLPLDENLKPGECRYITEPEIRLILTRDPYENNKPRKKP